MSYIYKYFVSIMNFELNFFAIYCLWINMELQHYSIVLFN